MRPTNLDHSKTDILYLKEKIKQGLTLVLNMFTSFMVQESALPMTGMMLTFL